MLLTLFVFFPTRWRSILYVPNISFTIPVKSEACNSVRERECWAELTWYQVLSHLQHIVIVSIGHVELTCSELSVVSLVNV